MRARWARLHTSTLAGLGRDKQGIISPLAALGNLRKSGLGLEVPCDGGVPTPNKKKRKRQSQQTPPKRKQQQQQPAAWNMSVTVQPAAVPRHAARVLRPGPMSLAALPLPYLPCVPHPMPHCAGAAGLGALGEAQQLCHLALQENAVLKRQMLTLHAELQHQQQAAGSSSGDQRQKRAEPPEQLRPAAHAVLKQQVLTLQDQLQQQQRAATKARVKQRKKQAVPSAPVPVIVARTRLAAPAGTLTGKALKKAQRAQKLADRAERRALKNVQQQARHLPCGICATIC